MHVLDDRGRLGVLLTKYRQSKHANQLIQLSRILRREKNLQFLGTNYDQLHTPNIPISSCESAGWEPFQNDYILLPQYSYKCNVFMTKKALIKSWASQEYAIRNVFKPLDTNVQKTFLPTNNVFFFADKIFCLD